MQKKNATIFRILLVAIAMVLFLLIMGGGVQADVVWDIDESKFFWWNDADGDKFSGVNNGIEWEAKVLVEDSILEGTAGTVSLRITNGNSLTSSNIVLPDRINIPRNLFTNWHEYQYDVTEIVSNSFTGASKVTSITLGKNVTTISPSAFDSCTSLSKILVSASNPNFTSVDGVLYNKSKTKLIKYPIAKSTHNFTFPNTVNEIGDYAFSYNSTNEAIVKIPEKITKIGAYAFYKFAGLKEIEFLNNEATNGLEIGNYAFRNCTSLEKIKLPERLKVLSQGIFYDCTSLKEVELGSQVTEIKASAFYGDKNLTTINLPNTLTSIGSGAFNSTDLKNVVIPDSVNTIDSGAFRNCTSLEKVVLPSGLNTISTYLFYGCTSLKDVNFPSGITSIGMDSFYKTLIEKIEVPKSVTSIANWAFENCSNLKCVVLHSGLTSIPANVFLNSNEKLVVYCTSSEQLNNITKKPTYITYEEKEDHIELLKFYPDTNKSCTEINLLNYIYNKPFTIIGEQAFKNNTQLTKVTIPNTVTTIKREAFAGCSELGDVFLPKELTTIGDNAFNGCENATIIVNKNTNIDSIGEGVFENVKTVYHNGENDILNQLPNGIIDITAPDFDVSSKLNENKKSATITIKNIADPKIDGKAGSGAYKYAISLKTLDELTDEDWLYVTGTEVSLNVTKNGTYHIYVMDKVGNVFTSESKNVKGIDEQAPVIDIESLKIEGSTNGAKISVKVQDAIGTTSGLDSFIITKISDVKNITSWNKIETTSETQIKTISQTVGTTGTYYLYVKDKAGNVANLEINVESKYIDNIKPEIIEGDQEPQVSENDNSKVIYETIEFTLSDSGSGLAGYVINENNDKPADSEWIKLDTNNYTFTYKIEKNGTYYIHAIDNYGNYNYSEFSNLSEITDLIAPRISFGVISKEGKVPVIITDSNSGIASGAVISYAWGTSSTEAPTNFVPATLEYDNGATEVSFDADGNSIEEQGNYYLWLKVTELKDVAGNEFAEENVVCVDSEGNPISFEFDNEKPSVENEGITIADKLIRDNEKVIITITTTEEVTIDENVKPIIASDSEAKDCIIGEIQGDGTTWTIEIEGGKDNGEVKICLPEGLFIDEAGNKSEEIIIEGLKVDNLEPKVTDKSSVNKTIVNEGTEIIYTLILNEKATLDEEKTDEITLTGEGIEIPIDSVEISEDGKTVTITATAGEGNGEVTLNLPAGLFTDEAGNKSEAKGITGVTIDNTAPTLEITGPDKAIINKDSTATFEIKPSETIQLVPGKTASIVIPATDTDKTDTLVTATIVCSQVEGSNNWNVYVTGIDCEGAVRLVIPEEMFIDVAGNATQTEFTKDGLTIDNTAPEIINDSITYQPEGEEENYESAIISITADENGCEYALSTSENFEDITEWQDATSENISVSVEENGTYYLFVKDSAGNITKVPFVVDELVILIENITFDEEEPEIAIGEEADLAVTITPSTATEKIEWSSSNEEVAIVDENGKVTGVAAGTATITAKAENKEVSITITVYDPTEITGIEITSEPTKVDYLIGEDIDLTGLEVKLVRRNGSKEVTTSYEVSPYDNTKAGEQTITITYQGKTATFIVTFTEPIVIATSITLSAESLELEEGESSILTARILPENTTDKTVTWSSDSTAATVDSNGMVTAVGEGTAVITATSNSDSTVVATCIVTVTKSSSGFTSEFDYDIMLVNNEKYLTGINPETKISDLIKFVEEGYTITVKDSNGNVIDENDYTTVIGTEMTITLTKGTKTLTYILVVEGDCTGDGQVTAVDLLEAVRQYKGKGSKLTTAKLLAIKSIKSIDSDYSAVDLIYEVKLYKKYRS